MRSAVVRRFGGPEVVEIADLPLPQPSAGHVRVRLAAATINNVDRSTVNGLLQKFGLAADADSYGLGWDVAGVVDATGPGVVRHAVGDRVVGLRDLLFAGGALAEYVVLHERALAPAPRTVDDALAATLPLNALTADGALALTGARWGDSVLVTGAAGAVGGYALELAAIRGIRTIALARPGDEELLADLRATHTLTDATGLAAAVRDLVPEGVDAVIDAANLGIAAHDALRDGGAFVALVRPFAPPPIRATRVVVQETHADGSRLTELVALLDAGLLTPRVAATVPLADVRRGFELHDTGGRRGRVVVTMQPEPR